MPGRSAVFKCNNHECQASFHLKDGSRVENIGDAIKGQAPVGGKYAQKQCANCKTVTSVFEKFGSVEAEECPVCDYTWTDWPGTFGVSNHIHEIQKLRGVHVEPLKEEHAHGPCPACDGELVEDEAGLRGFWD